MKTVIHPDFADMTDFIRQLPERFPHEGEMLHNGRNQVRRFRVNGREVVVKRYKRPHLIQRIVYTFFKPSKAERAYRYAAVLRAKGFDTPHEVSYIEKKSIGLFRDSYFVSLNCTYPPLSQVLRKRDFECRPADELAVYLAELHEKGVLHGDLNLTNILYRTDGAGRYHFTLIDTNRSVFRESLTQDECLENLKRITHNKALLRYVLLQYAQVRGWDARECVMRTFRHLLKFEQGKRRKRRFQSWMGVKK